MTHAEHVKALKELAKQLIDLGLTGPAIDILRAVSTLSTLSPNLLDEPATTLHIHKTNI